MVERARDKGKKRGHRKLPGKRRDTKERRRGTKSGKKKKGKILGASGSDHHHQAKDKGS